MTTVPQQIRPSGAALRVLLLSTYELGHQPFGLASPAAWLRAGGSDVTCVDVDVAKLTDDAIRAAELVGVYLPMHTATRLAVPLDPAGARSIRRRMCAHTDFTRRSTRACCARSASRRCSVESSRSR